MRFSAIAVALYAAVAAARGLSLFGHDQEIIPNDDLKIPGDSPLELCPAKDHDKDIATILSVDLSPNPPSAGTTLVIKAKGKVSEDIIEGAYALIVVKYGIIKLLTTKADLCEQVKNVDLECPIEKGLLVIEKSVDLPNEIPPGKYNVVADVYTVDDKPITCLTATVTFSRKGAVVDL